MTQEDIGESALGQEIQANYQADPVKFIAMLEVSKLELLQLASFELKRSSSHSKYRVFFFTLKLCSSMKSFQIKIEV